MRDVVAWSKLNRLRKALTNFKSAWDTWKEPWTAPRANKLDNLDASVSTRAQESSVVSVKNNFDNWKAPWTSARAGKIDTIANDTHSVWNSIPSGTDSVAKQTTLNTVNSNVGTINSNVSTLVRNMGAVKSVQRIFLNGNNGVVLTSSDSAGARRHTLTRTISPVNISKSIIVSDVMVSYANENFPSYAHFVENNSVEIGAYITGYELYGFYGDVFIVEFI